MAFTVFRAGTEIAGGRYVLERRLGSGGMATVWLARDVRLQRPVAIKIPTEALLADETWARRFEREAQTAASLSHPNLVPVYDYGSEGERPFLVSEYIDGPTLDKLRRSGDAPPTDKVAEALLAALDHIHKAGIVHRDIKPGNVLVAGWDRILLTDFGIAQSTEETRLTNVGHVVGTADFMAPEVKRGDRATPASDLYSCGVVLGELLRPGEPTVLSDLVDRLTAEDPGERPRGAADALALLEGGDDAARTAIAPAPVPLPAEPRSPESILHDAPPAIDPPTDERPVEPPERREEPPARTTGGGGGGPSKAILGAVAAVAALIVLAVVALGNGDGGGEETTGGQRQAANQKPEEPEAVTREKTVTETAPAPEPETTPAPVESSGGVAEGIALNDQGYELLQAGDVEGALPLLERSVAAFPEDSTDINHAYALFNYAQALRLSGDPDAAIPLLEKRLAISDYKRGVVRKELKLAQSGDDGGD